ncbi:hypothetical protein [Shewanella putrefaciens]|nr:hypothetical protein [Shewanella putrefaciens]QGS49014.1 hypothetical protein FOB89_08845 [Shewanella putrefaciens]
MLFTQGSILINCSRLSGRVTDQVAGLYSDFTTMLVYRWNTGATAVVDFASSVMGDPEFMQGVADSVSMGSTSASAAIGNMLYAMKEQVYSTINSMLPKELGKLLFKKATEEEVKKEAAQEVGTGKPLEHRYCSKLNQMLKFKVRTSL